MTKQQAAQQAEYAATRFNRTYYVAQRGNAWTYTPDKEDAESLASKSGVPFETFAPIPAQVAKYEAYWGHRADPADAGAQAERLARMSPANTTL